MSNDAFIATHAAPPGGMQTWSTPDPAAAPDNQLGGGLPVQLLEETVGWGHVRCTNGWECWVDARLLVALGAPAPVSVPEPVPVPVPAPAPAPVTPTPSPPYEPLLPPEPQAAPGTVEMQVPPPVGVGPAPAPAMAPVAAMPVPPPAPAPAPAVEPAPPPAPRDEFTATHRAPATGLATRERPDPGKRPNNRIEPGLELQVIERAESWARVRCSNGWETWVDGRYLVDL